MKYGCLLLALLLLSCTKNDTLFTLLKPGDTGVEFNNFVDEDADNNVLKYGYFYNGGGVAAADFNNDGWVDLYFTGNMVANKLYLNKGASNGGKIDFDDVSEQSGTALHEGWKTGVSLVDSNDDGWIDIYVCRSGAADPNLRRNRLYVNNGKTPDGIPTFTERAAQYGLDDPSYTTQAVFFDYDRDGDTDCFLLNHSVQEYSGFSNLLAAYREQKNDAYGNKLLRNDKGRYVNVTDSSGIVSNLLSFGLGINVSDVNNDGWQDLYIANDYNENDYLYLNQQNGTFREVIREATGHVSLFSMGTDAADINNDGLTDILTLDMLPESNRRIKLTSGDDNYDKYQQLLRAGFHDQTMRNMLHLNNGVNKNGVPVFSEIGQLAGVSNTDWSWSALMADFDNDGWKDIFISNGYARDYTNMEFLKYSTDRQLQTQQGSKAPEQLEIIARMPAIDEPNYIFQNQGNLTFKKRNDDWGFTEKSRSNGAVYADLDNDGDLDIVTNNVNQKAFIYRNNSETKGAGQFLNATLNAPSYALKAGAKVTVYAGSFVQMHTFMPVRGFQSALWGDVHFGLGKAGKVDSVRVQWANGTAQTQRDVVVNKPLVINYNGKRSLSPTEPRQPFFDEMPAPGFRHQEDERNDFRTQPLLPYMLSYAGPTLTSKDLNADGTDDFYVGGARGQAGTLFMSQGNTWKPAAQPAFMADAAHEDSDACFVDVDNDRDYDLLVTSQGYELAENDPLQQPRLYLNENGIWKKGQLPNVAPNIGTVATADVDSDGDQDIFLGSRVTPGRFPESRGGTLLINDGNGPGGKPRFSDQTVALAPTLKNVGMVTDALWQDINNDGFPELLLTADWQPIRLFANQNGKLSEDRTQGDNQRRTGCWNRIQAADLDGDGDTDFVVGNMGTNWQWNVASPNGLGLYAGDFDNLNRLVPVLTVHEKGVEFPYASRDELLEQVPSLKKKFTDYPQYAAATLADMLPAEKLKAAQHLTASEWRSGILENQNGRLVFRSLPMQAQFSPVYAISLLDVNQDRKPDVVLGGNMKQTRVRIGRNDASLVQVFVNQGNMKFRYVPQPESGFFVNGDVRDLVALKTGSTYCLAVGVNNGSLQLYRLKNKLDYQ